MSFSHCLVKLKTHWTRCQNLSFVVPLTLTLARPTGRPPLHRQREWCTGANGARALAVTSTSDTAELFLTATVSCSKFVGVAVVQITGRTMHHSIITLLPNVVHNGWVSFDINAYFWPSFWENGLVSSSYWYPTGFRSGLKLQWWISWTGKVNKAFVFLVKLKKTEAYKVLHHPDLIMGNCH